MRDYSWNNLTQSYGIVVEDSRLPRSHTKRYDCLLDHDMDMPDGVTTALGFPTVKKIKANRQTTLF